MNRTRAAAVAHDALRISQLGRYTNLLGVSIDLSTDIRTAIDGTVEYRPNDPLPGWTASGRLKRIEVTDETTLLAAERLHRDGHRVAALNFASAKHPGGGFLNGARAQEESLCRSSALFVCLQNRAMYADNLRRGGGFYTNDAIYSPAVPVFFTDAGNPLPQPYPCSFVTSPAVNAGVYLDGTAGKAETLREEMIRRVGKVLAVMAGHGHDTVVLGAWGCGVFRNDPELIAELFGAAFDGPFAGVFTRVVFAVWDETPDRRTRSPFLRRFGIKDDSGEPGA